MMIPSEVNLVLYHANCADGFGAAYAAWSLLGSSAEYRPVSHGNTIPNVAGKKVAILDFSYKNKDLKKMIKLSDNLIVIDHHKSAMEDLKGIDNAKFDMSKSGAMLAWEWFRSGEKVPKLIAYIQDRDLWKWELQDSKEFSTGLNMIPFDFHEYHKLLDQSNFDKVVRQGGDILSYVELASSRAASYAGDRVYNGLQVKVVNSSQWISEIGSILSPHCDFAMIWNYSHLDDAVRVSLRSFHDHIDVSKIALSLGGGGHKKASGFKLTGEKNVEHLFDL